MPLRDRALCTGRRKKHTVKKKEGGGATSQMTGKMFIFFKFGENEIGGVGVSVQQ